MPGILATLKEVVTRIGPLGFLSFGGPSIHVVLFRKLFVLSEEKAWLDNTTFADLFSLSGALPGPGSTQLLFSIALVRGGALAGFLAFFIFSLPGAVIMFAIALGVSHLPSSLPPIVLALLTGLNAAAVGLIFFAAVQLSRATATTPLTKLVLFATAAIGSCYSAVWLFPVLTIGGGVVTLAADWSGWERGWKKVQRKKVAPASVAPDVERPDGSNKGDDIALEELGQSPGEPEREEASKPPSITRLPTPPPDAPSTTVRRRPNAVVGAPGTTAPVLSPINPPTPINLHLTVAQSGIVIAFFFTLVLTFVVLQATLHNPPRALKLFTQFLIAGSILFGGGPVVVPLLRGYTSDWVSTQNFLLGYALLSACPGPNFNFAVFLGTLSLPHAPVLGAVLGYLGIFTPGILLKFALLPAYSRFRQRRVVRTSLTGLNSAASGLVWTAAFRLWKVGLLTSDSGGTSLEKSGYWISVAGAAYLASESFGVQAPLVIVGGAIGGLLYGAAKGAP